MAYINRYIHVKLWDVLTHSCHNGDLVTSLKLRHARLNASRRKQWCDNLSMPESQLNRPSKVEVNLYRSWSIDRLWCPPTIMYSVNQSHIINYCCLIVDDARKNRWKCEWKHRYFPEVKCLPRGHIFLAWNIALSVHTVLYICPVSYTHLIEVRYCGAVLTNTVRCRYNGVSK